MIRHASTGTMEELRREQRQRRIDAVGQATPASGDIFWDPGFVGTEDRIRRNGHRPKVVWFTGISGSGKSTVAKALEKRLFDAGFAVVRLDGDNVRHGMSADLAFSREDRRENIRRVGYMARQLYDFGNIVLCTFVSPYREDRAAVRALIPKGDFVEVFMRVDLDEARRRDPKGLYQKAAAGELREFTGIDAPYDEPTDAEVVVDTNRLSVTDAVARLFDRFDPPGPRS